MKTKEDTTAIVKTAITDLRTAISYKNSRNIIQVLNDVENDPNVDLEIISDELFKQWEIIAKEAYNLI